MSGFEISRFVNLSENESKHLKCDICFGIYRKPVVIECGHTFCVICIKDWIKTCKTCPLCRHELSNNSTNNGYDLNVIHSEPTRLVIDLINDLIIKCDNYDNGCHERIRLESYQFHLNECHFKLCFDCGLKWAQISDHNCVELLKKQKFICDSKIIALKNENNKFAEQLNEIKSDYHLLNVEKNRLDAEIEKKRFIDDKMDYLLFNHKTLVPQPSQQFLNFISSLNLTLADNSPPPEYWPSNESTSEMSSFSNPLRSTYTPTSQSITPQSPTYTQFLFNNISPVSPTYTMFSHRYQWHSSPKTG